jgi:hypothetical protein
MKSTQKLLIVLCVLIIAALACSSESSVEVNPPANDEQNVEPTQAPEVEEPTTAPLGASRSNPAPLGSEIVADEMSFSVTSVTRPATDIIMAGNMFNTEPENGQEYVMVQIQIACSKTSDQQCSISPFNFSVLGSSGIAHEAEIFVSGVDGLLESGDFYGGASLSGSMPFIVGSDETGLLLVYEPFFGDPFYLAVE